MMLFLINSVGFVCSIVSLVYTINRGNDSDDYPDYYNCHCLVQWFCFCLISLFRLVGWVCWLG